MFKFRIGTVNREKTERYEVRGTSYEVARAGLVH